MTSKAYVGEAKIFTNGGSQAVRLPAECRVNSNLVAIQKLGSVVILKEKNKSWDEFFARPRLPKEDRIQRGYRSRFDVRRPFK